MVVPLGLPVVPLGLFAVVPLSLAVVPLRRGGVGWAAVWGESGVRRGQVRGGEVSTRVLGSVGCGYVGRSVYVGCQFDR